MSLVENLYFYKNIRQSSARSSLSVSDDLFAMKPAATAASKPNTANVGTKDIVLGVIILPNALSDV